MSWQPKASFENLKIRANIINQIRAFFAERNILEVETPLLSHATVTALHLQSFSTQYDLDDQKQKTLYLQTSPEYAMKRLLAAGSGPIYQICKSFRNHGEAGRLHNPEFTMLEWYRPGFNHHDLMDETDELFKTVLNLKTAERFTYEALFQKYLGINPHQASIEELKQCAIKFNLNIQIENQNPLRWRGADEVGGVGLNSAQSSYPPRCLRQHPSGGGDNIFSKDDWLMLLMSHIIEPNLGKNNQPTFVYNFPASQAALARINGHIAERFEVYINGMELANGFHELSDAKEQRQRFENDLAERAAANYLAVPIDENLLKALANGFPNCAGIAVGIDRLVMAATKAKSIADVVSFTVANS